MVQVILSILVVASIAGLLYLYVRSRQRQVRDMQVQEFMSIDSWADQIGDKLAQASLVTEYEIENNLVSKPKLLFANSYEDARNLVPKGVAVVKGAIRDMAEQELNEETIDKLIDFKNIYLENPNYSFTALVYWLTEVKGIKEWFHYVCDTYNIDKPKEKMDETGRTNYYCEWTTEELMSIIKKEIDREITYPEKLDIITQIAFMKAVGPHVATIWYNSDIDGFHYGTRGSIRYKIEGNFHEPNKDTNSLAVQIYAKWIQIPFLDFENIDIMKRCTDQLTGYGGGKDLSDRIPSKVTDGFDGSRIVAIVPPVAESYGCFVRKFSKGLYSKLAWFNNKHVHNYELPMELIKYIMKAEITTAVTGMQNSGKTTLMKIMIGDAKPCNIRVLEMTFELALREIYKDRDIFTCKETEFMSSEEIQDIFKKCDAYLSLVGEVATNIVAARMIQFCIIASAFTLFSHHALDDEALVMGLASSLVSSGEYENHDVAVDAVLDAIKMNVHVNFVKGERVVEYISFIDKLPKFMDYEEPEKAYARVKKYMGEDASDVAIASMVNAELNKEYYRRSTDRKRFESHKLMYFNADTMTYEAGELFPPKFLNYMLERLSKEDRISFSRWYIENWVKKGGQNAS